MKKIYILAAVTLALAACDSNDDNQDSSSVAVTVTATIEGSLPSRAVDTSWTPGDKIGITAIGAQAGSFINLKYITDDGSEKFTGNTIYFYKNMTLTAYYPFSGTEGTVPGDNGILSTITDADNQTGTNQLEIDFLFAAQSGIKAADPNVNFNFSHRMSKLTLTFESGNDATEVSRIKSYTIDGLVLQGTFNTVDGTAEADYAAGTAPLTISVSGVTSGASVPSLILFPQSTAGKTITMKISDDESQDYVCELRFTDDALVSGNSYNYVIKVSKTGLSVNTPTITPWNETVSAGSDAKSDLSPLFVNDTDTEL